MQDDLLIEGQIDGSVTMEEHGLWIGRKGRFSGEALARAIVVAGTVSGTVRARGSIEVQETASIDGEIVAPEISIASGAQLRAKVDTQRAEAAVIVARHRLQSRGTDATSR